MSAGGQWILTAGGPTRGIHEERLFTQGEPTSLVRNDGVGSFDPLPVAELLAEGDAGPSHEDATPSGTDPPQAKPVAGPAKPWLTLAALLIMAGVVVGILGITGGGRRGVAETTTTVNPILRVLPDLPRATTPTTESPIERALRALPPPSTPTTESPIERALQALPRSTTPAPTSPVTTKASASNASSRTGATRVTQPSLVKKPTTSIAATTTLPVTTTTTSVGPALQAWYLAYGSIFNTLQTDTEKLQRALDSTSQANYSTVDPYWQELFADAGQAILLPAIPDGTTQSEWASALGDLSAGATQSILGSLGTTASSVPPIFSQGSALITTGTTQMNGALGSIESLASTTSKPSRSQVSAWYQSQEATFNTLQTDINKLDTAFSSTASSSYSTVDPYWQQLMSDAESAMTMAPVPDALIQSYWTTALGDLTLGSGDCIASSEGLPPNLFDQGVALIESGTSYLSTALASVQGLVG